MHCRATISAFIGLPMAVLLLSECWAADQNGNASAISPNGSDTRTPCYAYPSPILFDDLNMSTYYHSGMYNWGVVGFQVNNFYSYAAHFCQHDAKIDEDVVEIVSVGSGADDVNERSTIDMHRKLFGTEGINITRVNKNPKCAGADFQTVDDLIANRPSIVKNCVLLLIWPEGSLASGVESDDDIEAVRKLQPRAVLTLYETKYNASGSQRFRTWLLSLESGEKYEAPQDAKGPKLRKYRIAEAVYQEVRWNPRAYSLGSNDNETCRPGPPGTPFLGLRLVKLKRDDVKNPPKSRQN